MSLLPPELRTRARAWAGRPPSRDAASAAAAARASGSATDARPLRLGAAVRLAAAAAVAAAALAAGGLLAARAPGQPPVPTNALATLAPRLEGETAGTVVVVELSSGTSLYVTLPRTGADRRPRS
jgi:hypothetical protein